MEQLLKTVGLVASACQVTDISKLLPNREAQAEPKPSSSRRPRSPFSR
jgi:type VI secretion system protein ImpA